MLIAEFGSGESVAAGIPQAPAADSHVLTTQLTNVDEADDLVARDHQLFDPCLDHLMREIDIRID